MMQVFELLPAPRTWSWLWLQLILVSVLGIVSELTGWLVCFRCFQAWRKIAVAGFIGLA